MKCALQSFQTLLFVIASQSFADLAADFPALSLRQEGQGTATIARLLHLLDLFANPALCPERQRFQKGEGDLVAVEECAHQDGVSELGAAEALKVR